MPNLNHRPAGFTLIELLVATALFATVMAIAVNLFVLALRQPLIEVDNQHLQEEVNFMFEALSSTMSHATISYKSFSTSTITNPATDLYLDVQTATGVEIIHYYLSGTQVIYENMTTGDSYPVTTTAANDVAVDSLRFYIYPTSDPADPSAAVNYQPAVAVVLVGHSIKDTSRTFEMQTFLTSRIYVR